jgi:hypothetical protein
MRAYGTQTIRRTLRSGRPWRWTGTHDCTSGLASRDDGRRGADCRVKRSGATSPQLAGGRLAAEEIGVGGFGLSAPASSGEERLRL